MAEEVSEAVWLRMRRLTSILICRRLIKKQKPDIDEEVLNKKAEQTAWAVKTALGYWQSQLGSLNANVLSRYYALLQITIAEQVASPISKDSLEEVQKHTEYGHGLFTLRDPNNSFPHGYFIGVLNSGHFASYCHFRGIDLKQFAFQVRPRKLAKLTPEEKAKLISLSDILCRIPELQSVVKECLGVQPKSFQIFVRLVLSS